MLEEVAGGTDGQYSPLGIVCQHTRVLLKECFLWLLNSIPIVASRAQLKTVSLSPSATPRGILRCIKESAYIVGPLVRELKTSGFWAYVVIVTGTVVHHCEVLTKGGNWVSVNMPASWRYRGCEIPSWRATPCSNPRTKSPAGIDSLRSIFYP